ncbi:MAG: hypothetical protein Aurels2KO_22970 [Aureliella sp.]
MTMDATSGMGQTSDWAKELKLQLAAASETACTDDGQDAEPVSLQLSSHTLEMLTSSVEDLLLDSPRVAKTSPTSESSPQLTEEIASSIDASMAAWRSEIELSLAQSSTRQLESQLQQAVELSNSLATREQDIAHRESQLDERTSKLSEELAASLRIQARTERQRKTIAAGLRRQRAEMRLELANDIAKQQSSERQESEHLSETITGLRAQLEQSDAERAAISEQVETLRQRESELTAQVTTLNETLSAQEASAGNSDELQLKIRQLEEDNAQLEESLGNQREQLEEEMDAENARLLQVISKLNGTIEELEKQAKSAEDVIGQLQAAESEIEQLRSAVDNSNASLADAPSSEEIQQANSRIEQLEQQIVEKDDLLAQASTDAPDPEQESRLDELQQQVADYQEKIDALQQENDRLTAAEHSMPPGGNRPHVNFNQESLSWEERKKLIMEQLEDDTPQTSEEEATKLEIESILETTQSEIERRDRDIEELRSIIEQQSDTKQGVAIGAAAIAQMFDDDELVVQEREKLKSLQGEWEDKVRQAEIDISMERAKLARQRSEVESKVAELEAQLAKHGGTLPPPPSEDTAGGRTRKWLEHLGLKDEPS